jgi:hypothetical protein
MALRTRADPHSGDIRAAEHRIRCLVGEPTQLCIHARITSVPCPQIRERRVPRRRKPADAGAVNGMLPDLRFVLGASLAIAMLAVAGFGLAISTQLLHEARMSPVESTQSLAYAGQAEDNPFYDPNSVLRFTKGVGKPEDAAVPLRAEKTPEPIPAPQLVPEEPITPPDRIEANVAGEKAADPSPPAVEPAAAERPAPAEGTRPPEAAAASLPAESERAANAPAASPAADIRKDENTPPAEPERVANASAASPAADTRKDEGTLPAAGNAAASAPPAPAAKPVHRKPRPRIARAAPRAGEQGFQNSSFPTGNTQQWSSYSSPWGAPPGTTKKTGTVAGR